MAKKTTIDLIIKAFRELGGNVSDVLGTRTNVSFLGVGDNVEPFLDKNLNTEALGVLSQSKAIDEAKNSVGFAVGDKLNDIQANNLLTNLNKMKEFYMPPAPANITDLGTGTRNLDAEGLGSLRANRQMDADELADFEMQMGDRLEAYDFDGTVASAKKILADDKAYTDEMFAQYKAGKLDPVPGEGNREKFLRGKFEEMQASGDKKLMTRDEIEELSAFDDLPPPGSRGGADDIAAPVEQGFAGFERTIRDLAKSDPELAAQYRTVMTNKGDVPAKRASAREFLVEALKKDEYDKGVNFGKTQLNNIIDAQDVKFITEGGGGIGGDPIVLVEKYFGPRIAEALPVNASNEEIAIFTKRVLENVTDAAGLRPDNPRFDRFTAKFVDEMADGGRVGLRFGKLAGKAFGLSKKLANINKSVDEGTQMGYGALREYGIEAEDISRLFRELAMDKTMVGPEKTEYFKMLNQVLKNPDQFPDGIIEIKKRLGMDFARGGLAKILEV
jgi:hypothetical protein